jgi:hypothetical protein
MQNRALTRWSPVWSSAVMLLCCASLDVGSAAATGSGTASTDPRRDMIAALEAVGPAPSLGDQANVFGRLVGTWRIDYAFLSKDGTTSRSSGDFSVGWVMEGRVVQCLFTIDPSADRKEKYIGSSLNYFDAKSQTWRMVYVDPENDAVIRVTGGAAGNDRIVLLTQEAEGKVTRWSFNDIRPDSFVYRDEVSHDGGKTWRLQEEDHMTRRGAAPPGQ